LNWAFFIHQGTKPKEEEEERPDMQVKKMERVFKYLEGKSAGGVTLPDPNPALDVESVRALFCTTFPEIATAALTGPEAVDDKLVYTFLKSIGVKG
jgi:PRTRC genetic system protein C